MIAALAMTACGDGEAREDLGVLNVANAACDALTRCGCGDLSGLAGFGECTDVITAVLGVDFGGFDEVGDVGDVPRPGGGPVYDPVCAERWTDWLRNVECDDPDFPSFEEVCAIYHGYAFEGQPCISELGFTSDCGHGLMCLFERCVDPSLLPTGGVNELCDPIRGCDPGLECIQQICMVLPGPGAPCFGECTEGSTCQANPDTGESICVLGLGIGAPCSGHAQCASGNCPRGTCEAPAAIGSPCSVTLPCGPDLQCVQGSCAPGPSDEGVCALFGVVETGIQ